MSGGVEAASLDPKLFVVGGKSGKGSVITGLAPCASRHWAPWRNSGGKAGEKHRTTCHHDAQQQAGCLTAQRGRRWFRLWCGPHFPSFLSPRARALPGLLPGGSIHRGRCVPSSYFSPLRRGLWPSTCSFRCWAISPFQLIHCLPCSLL